MCKPFAPWNDLPLLYGENKIKENSGPTFYFLFAAGLPPVRTSKSSKNIKIDHLLTTKEWSMKNDVKEFPTNAFGHIKFANVYNSTLKPAKVCNWIKILIMLITRQQSRGAGSCQRGTWFLHFLSQLLGKTPWFSQTLSQHENFNFVDLGRMEVFVLWH